MITMNLRKSRPASLTVRSEVCDLGAHLSFLDVLSQACARNSRYTLTVDSPEASYTVLVDRGGPFNATGGGMTGSPALVHAAQLRTGRCALTQGWPVDQPMYQPGLDMTLKALMNGAVEPAALPRHRGVDSLRNAEFRDAQFPVAEAAGAFVRPAELPTDQERLLASLEQPEVQATPRVAPSAPALPLPPSSAGPAVSGWKVVETAPRETHTEPTAAPSAPPEAHEGAAREAARHIATRALLWMVEVEESQADYTLKQAASLAGRGLVDGIGDMLHPLKHDLGQRIHRVKAEWEKSGEVAAKQSRKERTRRISAIGDFDPDNEFRLR